MKDNKKGVPVLVADSCCDTNASIEARVPVKKVPFPVTVGGRAFLDDGSVDLMEFLQAVSQSSDKPQTAGPSPQRFLEKLGDATQAFIITITGKLSGTYSNAMVALEEWKKQDRHRKGHVFDSQSASGGETALLCKLQEWIDEGLSFNAIVKKGEDFIRTVRTYFVLEDLSTLVKAGRLPSLAGRIASTLSITPICSGEEGEIKLKEIKRGMKSALKRLGDILCKAEDAEGRTLYLTHINAPERAQMLRERAEAQGAFKSVEILDCGILSATYANDGGIIAVY